MTVRRVASAICLVTLLLGTVTARGQAPAPPSYLLGSDDVLEINVWPQSDFARTVTVGPDGRITVPPLGEFYVVGLTPAALGARVSDQLKAYLKNARVTVVVKDFKGKRVSVLGQVRNPGLYKLKEDARLVDAIATAGGPTFAARLQSVYITRGGPGNARVMTVNFERVLTGEDQTSDLLLQTNDIVFVPGTLSAAMDDLRKIAPGIQIQIQVQGQGP